MFAVVFALRTVADQPSWGLSYLYVLPIIVVALDRGLRGGVLASLVAFALYTAGSLINDSGPPLAGYLPRGATYLAVGALTGWMADRLRATGEQALRFLRLSRDLCCTANLDGYFVQLNGAWEKALGWSRGGGIVAAVRGVRASGRPGRHRGRGQGRAHPRGRGQLHEPLPDEGRDLSLDRVAGPRGPRARPDLRRGQGHDGAARGGAQAERGRGALAAELRGLGGRARAHRYGRRAGRPAPQRQRGALPSHGP